VSEQLNADKALLRKRVLELRQQGMSYRQIGAALGIHWTRVGQIVKGKKVV
jgi:predicted XRE-type DNA-binding protein